VRGREPDAAARFRDRFGSDARLRVDVPGRINLIGDHIDYNGLGVLPLAIQRRLRLHARPRPDNRLRAVSVDGRFPDCIFDLSADIASGPPGDWCNYVRAAAQDSCAHHSGLHGLDMLVESTIPVAAGLSSSSALVVATALALLHANAIDIDPLYLADRLAVAEHYVGTRGGGMDQAVLLGARHGCAARIDFRPLRLLHVPVPPGWFFVAADSGVPAEKSRVMRAAYNTRAAECARALGPVSALLPGSDATYSSLLQDRSVAALVDTAARVLEDTLLQRFRHVITEADRVRLAGLALDRNDPAAFGALMDASHASLRDDFHVSSPALDALVRVAKEAGAAGARLTGAGFGGCIVALCTADVRDNVVHALRVHASTGAAAIDGEERLVLVAEPSTGARITTLL